MTTRQFNSLFAAFFIWIVMIYYWWLENSLLAAEGIELSLAWYWSMLLLGSIPAWIFITDARQQR
jgi:hypothetical protein